MCDGCGGGDCSLAEHPAPSSIPPSRVMPAIVAKQLNELGKVRVQTEGFRDATDVVMESVSCDLHAIGNAAIQGLNCRDFGRRRIQRCGRFGFRILRGV
jgi:hypothetical protein